MHEVCLCFTNMLDMTYFGPAFLIRLWVPLKKELHSTHVIHTVNRNLLDSRTGHKFVFPYYQCILVNQ